MKFAFLRVANRLTGISTPVFGASWKPPELDVDVANELITFLEDRRMLTVPHAWENAQDVVKSVMETRAKLTEVASRVDPDTPPVRAHAPCELPAGSFSRTGGGRTSPPDSSPPSFGSRFSDPVVRGNLTADLGELRGVFGIPIARISAAYGIDVEEDLAAILPEDPTADEEDD